MTPAEKKVVLKKYPRAFGWREFSISDYSVHSGNGQILAVAFSAAEAWKLAAKRVRIRLAASRRSATKRKGNK